MLASPAHALVLPSLSLPHHLRAGTLPARPRSSPLPPLHNPPRRHPASGYVQGINDLVTPFMCVFAGEHLEGPLEGWCDQGLPDTALLDVEADCYW